MHKVLTASLLLSLAAVVEIGSVEAVSPPDPVPVFELWAAAQGTPVSQPACHVTDGEPKAITCYGLTGDLAGGYDGVVVGIAVVEDDGLMEFVPLPLGVPPGEASEPASGNSFGPGTQIVGQDIQPGTYVASTSDSCYWERLSGFSGEIDDVITNDIILEAGAQVIVEIAPSDVGFNSNDCGTWTLLE